MSYKDKETERSRRKATYKKNVESERLRAKAYHHSHKETHWASGLKKNHGILPETYYQLLAAQGGVCAICGKPPENGKKLSVDHDHATDETRGLLCSKCNRGIGYLQDSIEILKKAIRYLEEPVVRRRRWPKENR